ncbi:putative LRR receptor-like serine/threonine-protein kinase [Acorus calamus]|uniref:LRR receptor-like serine/threonine-protein kinase n=1 Tax=Acorus calamus TaxID=4465 RepID=A0AAV9CW35_ACOCL|nr:putative LRR receptor-like serine/threonine-protein kinase [Acorus calamus]
MSYTPPSGFKVTSLAEHFQQVGGAGVTYIMISPSSPADTMSSSSHSSSIEISILIGAVIMLLIIIIMLVILWRYVKPKQLKNLDFSTRSPQMPDYYSGNLRTISYFDYQTLKKATKNFHPENQLGMGGFGPVYQGVLNDKRMIAVKKLSNKSQQGESEFLGEVRMITSIQHKNLLRLLGCCSEGPQRLLVYEFMKNRSLDNIIYAPEYAIRGELSEKADIYSFGVLVLEIISSRKNTDLSLPSEMQYLPDYAWKLHERSRIMDLVDPKLRAGGFIEKDVLQVCNVALLCLQQRPSLRPPMSEIVAMLTCKGNFNVKIMQQGYRTIQELGPFKWAAQCTGRTEIRLKGRRTTPIRVR